MWVKFGPLGLVLNSWTLWLFHSKSLYRSRAGRHFYGTENEIWAGFGPVGNTEKKKWADYEQLLRAVFLYFHGPIFF